jgi:predicted transcriptional regulator
MNDSTVNGNFIELTAEIVSAYVSNNIVPAGEIPGLINQVHAALSRVSGKSSEGPSEPLKPAVSVKKSITPEHIVCLEDGKKFKSLKRHLRTQYNMTPEQYREKWGLSTDYPMVAPNYAAARSQLAKQMGLGSAHFPAFAGGRRSWTKFLKLWISFGVFCSPSGNISTHSIL